jgi:transketolase
MSDKPLPRDAFIDEVYDHASKDRNVVFITADLGAKALDRFRRDLPGQFFHLGICEQNMIDVAAGLAQNGRIVFVYAMGPFVTLRCLEQIKVALASMHLPCCVIGNGVGYSYDDAGPTHYATEDVGCMRSIAGCEVLTVGDTWSARLTARRSCTDPGLRYVRLDRAYLPDVHPDGDERLWNDGIAIVAPGEKTLLLANGYMLQRALEVRGRLAESGPAPAVADLFRVAPIQGDVLRSLTAPFDRIVTIEEHFVSGGSGGAIAEAFADHGILKPLMRIAIPDQYRFDNGGRRHLLEIVGLGVPAMAERVRAFAARSVLAR